MHQCSFLTQACEALADQLKQALQRDSGTWQSVAEDLRQQADHLSSADCYDAHMEMGTLLMARCEWPCLPDTSHDHGLHLVGSDEPASSHDGTGLNARQAGLAHVCKVKAVLHKLKVCLLWDDRTGLVNSGDHLLQTLKTQAPSVVVSNYTDAYDCVHAMQAPSVAYLITCIQYKP